MFKSCWDCLETIFAFRNHLYGICTSIVRGILMLCWIHADIIFVLFSATSECTHTLLAYHATEETDVLKSLLLGDAPQSCFHGGSKSRQCGVAVDSSLRSSL